MERELVKNTDEPLPEIIEKVQKVVHELVKIKSSRELPTDKYVKEKEIMAKMAGLQNQLIKLELDNEFVPNSYEHLKKYDRLDEGKAFNSEIEEDIVEKIMLLDVEANWKVLLMMGIGVFTNHKNPNAQDIEIMLLL